MVKKTKTKHNQEKRKKRSSCKYKKFEELIKKNFDEQNDRILNIIYVDSKNTEKRSIR